jgi:TRAP-type mannitol/chloroaromatic compound transport system permease small subunit
MMLMASQHTDSKTSVDRITISERLGRAQMIIRLMILGAITKDRMRRGLNNNADAQEVEIQWYTGGT